MIVSCDTSHRYFHTIATHMNRASNTIFSKASSRLFYTHGQALFGEMKKVGFVDTSR